MNEKKHIKLIGADLDGTLLNDDKQLCDGAAATIAKAKAQGVQLVPVTGRPLKGIPSCIRELKEIDYYICSNGAQIIDAKTGKSLYSFTIDNARCRQIITALRALDCRFEPFTDGVGYAEPDVYEYYKRTFTGTPLADYVFSSRKVTDSIEALYAEPTRTADEFFVNCADKAVRDELIRAMNAIGNLQYCLLGDRFAEITNRGTDKGEALAVLCRHLNIDISETMAFGDGENDLLLLEKAGVAVAMGNAFPSIKEKAAVIADTNNHNGVCNIIETLLD